jgi:hypothetical protein
VDAIEHCLTHSERTALLAVLDALLPPTGSFPPPSETNIIDEFILKHLPHSGEPRAYPGIDVDDLRAILEYLSKQEEIVTALQRFEKEQPEHFQALWALAVFGYYSRQDVIAAIQGDLKNAYHGAPLPLGYAHVISPWDESDPLQMPVVPAGTYIATEDVRRVDLEQLEAIDR